MRGQSYPEASMLHIADENATGAKKKKKTVPEIGSDLQVEQ